MLTRLVISNYALIDELSVSFEPGFNIVTGETGAGKSIILGALSLILGTRADFSSMRDPGRKCIVEGYFNLDGRDLEPFFAANDLDYDSVSILRREITSSGKSRAFINDTPVTLQVLRELSLRLIDIHSQHQNLELNTQQFQLQLVDTVARSEEALKTYQVSFREFNAATQDLSALKDKAARSRTDLDYLTFQYGQLEEARLVAGEQEALEEERNRLMHAEEIKGTLTRVAELLRGDHFPVVPRLKESVTLMEKAGTFLKEATEMHQRLQSAYIDLADLAHETERLAEKTENNPHRLEVISLRLDLIYSLEQKHQLSSVEALIALKNDLYARIGEITGYDEEIEKAEAEIRLREKKMKEGAMALSALRRKVFPAIESGVTGVLRQLAIPHARFIVDHEVRTTFAPSGADNIQFLFTANRDVEPAEISKIASGGEISRLMLALKTLVSGSKMFSTIIFDEIDAGISGETALKMGQILKQLSTGIQVINITHLPQIAGKGDHHFLVYKVDNGNGTFTSIRKLDGEERVEEMARMVGGDRPSENARETAREMLTATPKTD